MLYAVLIPALLPVILVFWFVNKKDKVEKDYKNYYSIKKGTINKSLNELLKIIEIDLDTCASPDYNK